MTRMWFAVVWAVGGVGILLAVWWAAGSMRQRFFHDFRGQKLPAAVRPFGPQAGRFVKDEPDGLRITLPKDRKEHRAVGLALTKVVPGDFEITVTFEILAADEPPPSSFGVGVLMTADETARIGRLTRAKGQQVVIWDQWIFEEGKKPKFVGNAEPCEANVVSLRMKRTGTNLSYLWAPDAASEDFQVIHEEGYRADDIKEIRVMAETGTQPCALDVRFLTLRVATAPGTGQLIWWLAAAGLAVGAGGVVGWRWVRSRAASPSPAPAAGAAGIGPTADSAASEAGLVICPQCQKRLKVSAKVIGKKIKCPGCEAAFIAEK